MNRKNIPKHVAIIMDGNRRWAKEKKLRDIDGHKKGADNLENIAKISIDFGIKILTVYAFSTENLIRSKKEIESLMQLLQKYLIKYKKNLLKYGIRLCTIGDLSKCPQKLQKTIEQVKDKTKDCNKMDLVLAINYGGRDEITRAFKKIVSDIKNKKMEEKDISEDVISSYLDTSFCPDPDLLIRTSGERRLSNFLLWQMSYAEFFIADVLWPDFSKKHFKKALKVYERRNRRFGI